MNKGHEYAASVVFNGEWVVLGGSDYEEPLGYTDSVEKKVIELG